MRAGRFKLSRRGDDWRARLQALDQLAQVCIAIGDVGVTGIQVELADRFVEVRRC